MSVEKVSAFVLSRTLYCKQAGGRIAPGQCGLYMRPSSPHCTDCPKWAEIAFDAEDKAKAKRVDQPEETAALEEAAALKMPLPAQGAETAFEGDPAVEPKTYTAFELATLAGVREQTVYNARKRKDAVRIPGSEVAKVDECMAKHGITWAQVVPGHKNRRPRITPENFAEIRSSMVPDLTFVTFEALVAEIQRRLPRAEITLR